MRISLPFPRGRDRAGAKQPGLQRQRWLLLPVILLLIAAALFWWLPSRFAPAATTTATVGQGDLTIAVTGSGSIAAARTVELPFQQSGTVTSVDVKVGDQVIISMGLWLQCSGAGARNPFEVPFPEGRVWGDIFTRVEG